MTKPLQEQTVSPGSIGVQTGNDSSVQITTSHSPEYESALLVEARRANDLQFLPAFGIPHVVTQFDQSSPGGWSQGVATYVITVRNSGRVAINVTSLLEGLHAKQTYGIARGLQPATVETGCDYEIRFSHNVTNSVPHPVGPFILRYEDAGGVSHERRFKVQRRFRSPPFVVETIRESAE